MPPQLAKFLGLLKKQPHPPAKAKSSFDIPFKQEVTNEVSELEGILLVRLGGCSAMQVRLEQERPESILIRIVPMGRATHLQGDAPWQIATDLQLQSWNQSGSAIWTWLLSRGIDSDKVERRLAALPSPMHRSKSLPFRPKPSLSLP